MIELEETVLSEEEINGLKEKYKELHEEALKRYYWCTEDDCLKYAIANSMKAIGDEVGGQPVKFPHTQYRRVKLLNTKYYLHQMVWLYCRGYIPTKDIDHRDSNGLNNHPTNLRHVTRQTNTRNRRRGKTKIPKSGYVGVDVYPKGKFRARSKVNGKMNHLGMFNSAKEAHEKVLEWQKEQGDFSDNHME